jgi:hypothetical protein
MKPLDVTVWMTNGKSFYHKQERRTMNEELGKLAELSALDIRLVGGEVYMVDSTNDFEIKLGVFMVKLKKRGYVYRVSRKLDDSGVLMEIFRD